MKAFIVKYFLLIVVVLATLFAVLMGATKYRQPAQTATSAPVSVSAGATSNTATAPANATLTPALRR